MWSWDEFYQGPTVGTKCSYLNQDRVAPAGVTDDGDFSFMEKVFRKRKVLLQKTFFIKRKVILRKKFSIRGFSHYEKGFM